MQMNYNKAKCLIRLLNPAVIRSLAIYLTPRQSPRSFTQSPENLQVGKEQIRKLDSVYCLQAKQSQELCLLCE